MSKEKAQKQKLEAQMQELDAELDKLKAQAKEASADQRLKYNQYLEALDEKRQGLKKKFDNLKEDSGDAFDELQAGMKDAWQRLAIAKRAAEARFQS